MELIKDIIAQDLFLYLKKYQALIISDIHIGYEESLQKHGILVPIKAYHDLIINTEKSINKLLSKKHQIKKIIINGDLLHNFSKIDRDEKKLLERFIDLLRSYGDINVIRGNHDKTLSFILPNINILTEIVFGDILITHGDKINKHSEDKNIKTIIIGHEHPAVSIGTDIRTEKFKCYLKGHYKKKTLIVMPSSNML